MNNHQNPTVLSTPWTPFVKFSPNIASLKDWAAPLKPHTFYNGLWYMYALSAVRWPAERDLLRGISDPRHMNY